MFDSGAVEPEAKGVAGLQRHRTAVGRRNPGFVGKAVAGVQPPVEAASEGAHHSMGVVMSESAEQDYPLVGPVVAVQIEKPIDVRDAVNNSSSRNRGDSHRYVESFGKRDKPIGAPIVVGVFEDQDPILPFSIGSGVGVLLRHRHPEAPAGIESQVHRLADLRLGGEQLDLESGRQVEAALLLCGRTRWRRPHVGLERVLSDIGFLRRRVGRLCRLPAGIYCGGPEPASPKRERYPEPAQL